MPGKTPAKPICVNSPVTSEDRRVIGSAIVPSY